MIPGPRAPTTRPSLKTTARWYSRRTLSPLSTNAATMAIAAHAPIIAASLQLLRLGRFLGRRGHGLRRRRCAFVLHLAFALFHPVDHEVTDKEVTDEGR